MSRPNYALKAEVLANHQNIIALQRRWSYLHFLKEHLDVFPDDLIAEMEALSDTVSFILSDESMLPIWREAERINLAYYKRVQRLKTRIASMLRKGSCFFLTLTFSDSALARTSASTRRQNVTRFCDSISDDYVANIDFGSENGREHYHAVVLANNVDCSSWDIYGFSKAEKIASADDFTPLAKYISKLTNHAVKATTNGCRAIYSR